MTIADDIRTMTDQTLHNYQRSYQGAVERNEDPRLTPAYQAALEQINGEVAYRGQFRWGLYELLNDQGIEAPF